jgi:glycosyltransferase involved in cell wall biosynthesis
VTTLPQVQVLLATYNGARFLREQIESILSQTYENVHLLARDDGSSDETPAILQEYARRFPQQFHLLRPDSTNQGVVVNFVCLMKAATANYICFADQDDVWSPDKIEKNYQAMAKLEERADPGTPLLVFSDLSVVDENLNLLFPSFWSCMGIDPARVHSINRILGRGVVTGCTMMINRALLELSTLIPEDVCLHDRWIALVASALGHANFIAEPLVRYRQHGRNAVGLGQSGDSTPLLNRLSFLPDSSDSDIREWIGSQRLAEAFLDRFRHQLKANEREELLAFRRCDTANNRLVRLATLLQHRFYCGSSRAKLAVLSHLLRRGASSL